MDAKTLMYPCFYTLYWVLITMYPRNRIMCGHPRLPSVSPPNRAAVVDAAIMVVFCRHFFSLLSLKHTTQQQEQHKQPLDIHNKQQALRAAAALCTLRAPETDRSQQQITAVSCVD